MTLNTAEQTDTLQVFDADTGASARIPNTTRLAHIAGGTLTVLETTTGEFSQVLTGCRPHLAFDSANAMWVVVENDIVELRLSSP